VLSSIQGDGRQSGREVRHADVLFRRHCPRADPVRAQHQLSHPVPGDHDRSRLAAAVFPRSLHARAQRSLGIRVLLLGEGVRVDVRARRGVGRHDELPVRHELARLHRTRRQHQRSAARLRGADGVLHRGHVSRDHAVRQGSGVERHAPRVRGARRLRHDAVGVLDLELELVDADAAGARDRRRQVLRGRLVRHHLQPVVPVSLRAHDHGLAAHEFVSHRRRERRAHDPARRRPCNRARAAHRCSCCSAICTA